MTAFAQFTITLGAALVLAATIAVWLFRTTAAPLWQRLTVPALLVALCCYVPFSVDGMMGLPVTVACEGLPQEADLVAFLPQDELRLVDLWLRSGGTVRAYETELTKPLKKVLLHAAMNLAHGQPAPVKRKCSPPRQADQQDAGGSGHAGNSVASNFDEDGEVFTLDEPQLPEKE